MLTLSPSAFRLIYHMYISVPLGYGNVSSDIDMRGSQCCSLCPTTSEIPVRQAPWTNLPEVKSSRAFEVPTFLALKADVCHNVYAVGLQG